MSERDPEFHAWLRTQFSTVDEAKVFARRWFKEMDQELPDWGSMSMRAMAAHISMALEGKEYESDGFTNYLETKHGSTMYFAMCGDT